MRKSEEYKRGHFQGASWATAKGNKLRAARVKKLDASLPADMGIRQWFESASAFTPAERLFFVIEPKQDGDREAAQKFWTSRSASGDVDYLVGFVEAVAAGKTVADVVTDADRLPADVEYQLLYGTLCEEVKTELAKRGLSVEGYSLEALGDDIMGVNREVAGGLDAPVTRRGWIAAIVDYRAALAA